MNLRRRSKATSEVSTHSLNDIMFFLLLFFLIASTMANPNVIKVLLPKAKTINELDKVNVTLTVTKENKYYIAQNEFPSSALKEQLEEIKRTNANVTVVLNIDSDVPWKTVVEILDLGKQLNVKMVAATDKK